MLIRKYIKAFVNRLRPQRSRKTSATYFKGARNNKPCVNKTSALDTRSPRQARTLQTGPSLLFPQYTGMQSLPSSRTLVICLESEESGGHASSLALTEPHPALSTSTPRISARIPSHIHMDLSHRDRCSSETSQSCYSVSSNGLSNDLTNDPSVYWSNSLAQQEADEMSLGEEKSQAESVVQPTLLLESRGCDGMPPAADPSFPPVLTDLFRWARRKGQHSLSSATYLAFCRLTLKQKGEAAGELDPEYWVQKAQERFVFPYASNGMLLSNACRVFILVQRPRSIQRVSVAPVTRTARRLFIFCPLYSLNSF